MTPFLSPSFIFLNPIFLTHTGRRTSCGTAPHPRTAQHPVSDTRMLLPFASASRGAQFVTIFLAAPTGTGGGGILVPAFILVGQFSPHSAVPLSKACILGGALINNIFNIRISQLLSPFQYSYIPTPLPLSHRRLSPKALETFSNSKKAPGRGWLVGWLVRVSSSCMES